METPTRIVEYTVRRSVPCKIPKDKQARAEYIRVYRQNYYAKNKERINRKNKEKRELAKKEKERIELEEKQRKKSELEKKQHEIPKESPMVITQPSN